MSHISVFVGGMACFEGDLDLVTVSGEARVDGVNGVASWSVEVPFSALATTINDAIKDSAIAAAEAQLSVSIGALDKKTLYAGAVGL